MAGTKDIITLAALGIGGYLLWTNKDTIMAELDALVAGGGGGAGGLVPPGGGEGEYAEGGGGGGGDGEYAEAGNGGPSTDVSGKGSCACSNGKCKGDCPAGGLDPQQMINEISRKARGGKGGGGGGSRESYAGSELAAFGFDELDMEMFGDFPADQFNSFYTELDPWNGYRDTKEKYHSIYKRNKRYNRYYVPKLFA